VPKSLFPGYAIGFRISNLLSHRNVGQVYIATDSTLVPAEHRVDRCAQLVARGLVDATGVNPEVLESVGCSALATETELCIAGLIRACSL
jgi:hypothetical protein